MNEPCQIAAFYRFTRFADHRALRAPLVRLCGDHDALGTILLAAEGINGTIAAKPRSMAQLLQGIRELTGLPDLQHKSSIAIEPPFKRLKVRLKKEIVTIGPVEADPNERVGAYVEPEDWNDLISDPDVIVLDTRNAYEVAAGTFRGSVNPETSSFGKFPDFVRARLSDQKGKKIAIFCTGGIRCEKASSFMLNEGFAEVFHLRGGILSYLERIPEAQSLWRGTCFVFDERTGVSHGLIPFRATPSPNPTD